MGIGSQMSGATMFVMYADGSGNVTISPRAGVNHVQPLYDSSIKVELLAGSGVSGGKMTANVKYTVDSSVLKASSSSTNWIAAWQEGSALNSKSTSASITQHDSHDQFTYDLTKATISTDVNPYVAAASSSGTPTGSASGTGTSGSSSPTSTSDSSDPLAGNSGSDSGSSTIKLPPIATYQTVHGVLMAVSFVILLPMGAIFMNLIGGVWAHAVIQMLAFFAIFAAFGVGVHLADILSLVGFTPFYDLLQKSFPKWQFSNTARQTFKQDHTILGIVVVAFIFLQPFIGLLHHRQYKKLGQRSYFGHAHMWWGRIIIVLGIINGGLGLRLAGNSKKGEIAYGVVSGIAFVAYVASILLSSRTKNRRAGGIKNGSSG